MKLKRLLICVAFCVFGLSAHSQVEEVIKLESVTSDALEILYSTDHTDLTNQEKENAVREILERNYDLIVIIRRTMGRNWKLLSSSEQSEVEDLITKLIVKAFVEGFQGMERPIIKYGAPVTITDKRFEVPSVITFPDGRVFNLVYRFGLLKTGFQVYDIVAEGVSVVSNYRQQFDDHFRKGTSTELIERLKQLLEKENFIKNNEL